MTGNHPFRQLGAAEPVAPVLLSVPHAGRNYPSGFALLSRLPVERVRPLEDRYADLLAVGAVERGISAIVADVPRVWIDLNRAEREFDPGLITQGKVAPLLSAKVRGGLGIIPRRVVRGGDIWRGAISASEFEARISRYHRPWHAKIGETLDTMAARFGSALLIDLHSMPPIPPHAGETPPRIVIGDLFGRSAQGQISEAALSFARDHGFSAALNAPYAGGHTLERHGRPNRGIHALQIEIDRSLYLDRELEQPGPGLAAIQFFVADLASFLAAEIGIAPLAQAAE